MLPSIARSNGNNAFQSEKKKKDNDLGERLKVFRWEKSGYL